MDQAEVTAVGPMDSKLVDKEWNKTLPRVGVGVGARQQTKDLRLVAFCFMHG